MRRVNGHIFVFTACRNNRFHTKLISRTQIYDIRPGMKQNFLLRQFADNLYSNITTAIST